MTNTDGVSPHDDSGAPLTEPQLTSSDLAAMTAFGGGQVIERKTTRAVYAQKDPASGLWIVTKVSTNDGLDSLQQEGGERREETVSSRLSLAKAARKVRSITDRMKPTYIGGNIRYADALAMADPIGLCFPFQLAQEREPAQFIERAGSLLPAGIPSLTQIERALEAEKPKARRRWLFGFPSGS